jgi:hypothetical protein
VRERVFAVVTDFDIRRISKKIDEFTLNQDTFCTSA